MRRIYSSTIGIVTLLLVLVAASGALGAGLQPQVSALSGANAQSAESLAVQAGGRKLPPPTDGANPASPNPNSRPYVCTAPVVNVSQRSGNEAETSVVINPTNTNNIVAFSNLASDNSIFRAYSMNGGATWTRGTVATNAACCDGQAAFDMYGNLFMVYINSAATQINVILSTDGGATFAAPVTAGAGSIDQPSIAVGNGSVWVDWNSNGSMVARGAPVTGLGTWGPFNAQQTIPSATGSFGGIAVGPGPNGGKVMVTYQNPTGGQGPATVYVNVDADGLGPGGFGARITATTTNVGGFDYIPAQNGRSIDSEAGLVWDATGGPFNDRAYLLYTEETVNENHDTEIYLRTSTNDGATWTAPVRVNDDPVGAPIRSQFLPYITLDRSTGTVAIGWHDARNDNGVPGVGGTNAIQNDDSEYYASYSTDGGVTWAPNTRLSGGFSNADAANNGVDYGDYVAQDAHGGTFVAVWADNANCDGTNANGTLSAFDLYIGKLTLPGGNVTPTPTVASTAAPTNTNTPVPTATTTRTNTAVPSSTSTRTNTAVATGTNTAIPTATRTHTSVPPATGTSTSTNVPISTSTTAPTSTSVASATSTICSISFSDVEPSDPFYAYIQCLACRDIISGYTDGTFRPGNDITRGQIAKMVSNSAGFSEDPGPQIYEDVPPASPFYAFINRLSMRGHMGGYPCGLVPEETCEPPDNRPYFRPNASATRGQLAKIVSNAAGLGGDPTGLFYTDVPDDHTFYVWIMRLTQLGVMSGYPCGTIPEEPCDEENRPYFRPFNNVTRGQASKIVANTFFPACAPANR
ncbi:MAG TPA: S-layer homology domain-containing protein [Chloroflexia bacterium]|nr:S-layer homology domain-containing protein [Chloroflexia bacterium]